VIDSKCPSISNIVVQSSWGSLSEWKRVLARPGRGVLLFDILFTAHSRDSEEDLTGNGRRLDSTLQASAIDPLYARRV